MATLENAPEHPGLADVQTLSDTRGPTTPRSEVTEVAWSSRFRLHHRLAGAYRRDRLFLMGDAAHVHSPAGGQGMNTGLVDAAVLGQRLAAVIAGKRGDAVLDRYQKLRRPAAAKVLGLAGRLTAMATMQSPARRRLRNALLSLVNRLPVAKQALAMSLSGLSRQRYAVL